ncbi:MAG: M56 family metallopeptidase [Pseudonocardiales bacterium]|jgi:Zn-dependent protease with chaperone function|nr:M56 family metallopeptidase [Pseudonocardiales bacterium]
MSVAACLLAYGLLAGYAAPRVLSRRACMERAPAWGVVIWLSAMISVAVTLAGGVALAVATVVLSPTARHVLDECVASLCAAALGDHGSPARWILGGVVLLAAVGVGAALVGAGRAGLGGYVGTRAHARTARLLGAPDPRIGVLVVDVPEKVAYAIGGRLPAIVVSRVAVQALTDAELDVVLAHERAHLAGRHHLVLGVARALATAVPTMRLFTTGVEELGRLLEMCADDVAVRGREVRHLITAMLTLSSTARLPRAALGGAPVGMVERAERLTARLSPRATRKARVVLLAGTTTLLSGPVAAVAVLCAVIPVGG